MLELWLIRHGETAWNAEDRIQGSIDLPLSAEGRCQAARLAPRLAGTAFDAAFASDLERARQTGEIALPGTELLLDRRLRELAYGVFEGKIWSALEADEAAMARHWHEDRVGRRIPGGESYGDLVARFEAFRAELPARGRVIAFVHGGTVRAAMYAFLGPPRPGVWRFDVANTGITRLRYRPDGVTIVTLNDHAHLDRVAGGEPARPSAASAEAVAQPS